MKIKKIAFTAADAIVGLPVGFAIGFTLPFIALATAVYKHVREQ